MRIISLESLKQGLGTKPNSETKPETRSEPVFSLEIFYTHICIFLKLLLNPEPVFCFEPETGTKKVPALKQSVTEMVGVAGWLGWLTILGLINNL